METSAGISLSNVLVLRVLSIFFVVLSFLLPLYSLSVVEPWGLRVNWYLTRFCVEIDVMDTETLRTCASFDDQSSPYGGRMVAALAFVCLALIVSVGLLALHFYMPTQARHLCIPQLICFVVPVVLLRDRPLRDEMPLSFGGGFVTIILGLLTSFAHFAIHVNEDASAMNPCGSKRRYMKGMTPAKFYGEELKPNMREVFEILHLDNAHGWKLFLIFIDIDADCGGTVGQDEFHDYFEMTETKFSERVFGTLDLEDTGELEFREFVIGVWNYCTLSNDQIIKFCFDLFDQDGDGQLATWECDALLRMQFDVSEADPAMMSYIHEADADGDGVLSLAEFTAAVHLHPDLLYPAFHIQEVVRSSVLGDRFWRHMSKMRQEVYADIEDGSHSSQESLLLIIEKKERARREEREEQERVAAEAAAKQAEIDRIEAEEAEEREKNARFDAVAVLKGSESKEDRAEARAWTDLEGALAFREKIAATQDFESVRKARQRCWVTLEQALQKRERSWRKKEAAAKLNAPNIARERFEIYRRTKEGSRRIRFDCESRLAQQRGLPPALAWYLSKGKTRNAVLAEVNDIVLNEVLGDHLEEIDNEFRKRQAVRDADSAQRTDKLVADWGTAHQMWDQVWSEPQQRWLWYDTKKGRTRLDRPHICEQCNGMLEAGDLKCFSCGASRSALNRQLYEACQPVGGLTELEYHEPAAAPDYDDWD